MPSIEQIFVYDKTGWKCVGDYQSIPDMRRITDYVAANYRLVERIGIEKWPVYRRNE